MIIQIIGLPGSGKTTLAKALKHRINALHLNADEVRKTINSDLGFSHTDRVEQARRMGAMAHLISSQGFDVIVDFICPTDDTRQAFGDADFIIWVDRIKESQYEDTNKLWVNPQTYNIKISSGLTVQEEVELVIKELNLFDWSAPTTLLLGRYQPWHKGHQALKEEAEKRTRQVVIGVRNTYLTSEKDPLTFEEVKGFIVNENKLPDNLVMRFPNITNIVYGRDVGYKIEKVELDSAIEKISATEIRKSLGI